MTFYHGAKRRDGDDDQMYYWEELSLYMKNLLVIMWPFDLAYVPKLYFGFKFLCKGRSRVTFQKYYYATVTLNISAMFFYIEFLIVGTFLTRHKPFVITYSICYILFLFVSTVLAELHMRHLRSITYYKNTIKKKE